MKTIDAKQYLQAVIDGLKRVQIQATQENVAIFDGAFRLLSELRDNIDKLEGDKQA